MCPPSTVKMVPVTMAAALEARNTVGPRGARVGSRSSNDLDIVSSVSNLEETAGDVARATELVAVAFHEIVGRKDAPVVQLRGHRVA